MSEKLKRTDITGSNYRQTDSLWLEAGVFGHNGASFIGKVSVICCYNVTLGFSEENTSTTPGTMVLGVAPEKGAGEAPEKASESGEAGNGCCSCCGPSCVCSPCTC
ncbi:hypothetical protein U9M48_037135 [Paspalum notatum var. saurae]|uniref:Metallothionein-like protein n=1 Tax=Paspalum notatum var. saurae TaxID=547442 RepID=A0AAQ3UKJ0_PASNO